MNGDDTRITVDADGADPMALAGINEANFMELQRALGVRVSQRGDSVTMIGNTAQLARATPVMQGMIDLVRRGFFPKGSTVLYAHLGCAPALNGYSYTFRNG